jgi:predicted nuclease of restriction endonuclease-like (RecB) superfamily
MTKKRSKPESLVPKAVASSAALAGYDEFLRDMKSRIMSAQLKAAVSVNRELIALYEDIGKELVERQEKSGWGDSVVEQLAQDLRREFPDLKGFSRSNIFYMRQFYLAWREAGEFVQQLVGQIPWGHNVALLAKVKDPQEREWYARQALQNGWSRNVLVLQIESDLYRRKGKAITNFDRTLPAPQSDLAQQLLKDPYNFDFLTLDSEARERDLERGLLTHIRQFLLELGVGFAFVGSQYHLEVGGDDFYIDLLFYHLRLRCFVVIDLKMRKFTPADAGQMNFYLSAVDDLLRHKDDQPSVGLILCKEENRIVAEYALRDMSKPIGVSAFQITESLPENLQSSLPTIEELESELSKVDTKPRG